jgi:hypothetical protein
MFMEGKSDRNFAQFDLSNWNTSYKLYIRSKSIAMYIPFSNQKRTYERLGHASSSCIVIGEPEKP